MKELHYLLTPGGSLILPTPIAAAENVGQNAEPQEKTSKSTPTHKVVAAGSDENVAQSSGD